MALPPKDWIEFVSSLNRNGVEYVLIGAHALAFHGVSRLTNDLYIVVRPTVENGKRVLTALEDTGFRGHGVTADLFATENRILQLGREPLRIDILTSILGVTFDEVWNTREACSFGTQLVPVIGREALITAKRAAGRPKDLGDLDQLSIE